MRPDPITIKDGIETIPLPGGRIEVLIQERDRLRAENAELKAQAARDDEHYKAAMDMSEKHRRNWVEACQQNAELRKDAERYLNARPLEEWSHDIGDAVWFTLEDGDWLGEPSWIGTPHDSMWPGYHTHWVPHPPFPKLPETDAAMAAKDEA